MQRASRMSYSRNFLTNEQKLQLRKHWSKHPDLSHFEVADWVREQFQIQISRSTLYRISQAPEGSFTGNLHQKKGRRVKYPEFESELVTFYRSCQSGTSGGGEGQQEGALTVDSLLRKAVELRTKHGIPHEKLKLSNGWMHKFKDRHFLKTPHHATGLRDGKEGNESEQTTSEQDEDSADGAQDRPDSGSVTRGRTTRSAPAMKSELSGSKAASEDLHTTPKQAVAATLPAANAIRSIVAPAAAAAPPPPSHIRPLTHISAKSLSTVRSHSILNWERTMNSGQAGDSHFAIVNDGIHVLRDGKYQINVDLEHTKPEDGVVYDAIFSVWNDFQLLDRCTSCLHCDPVTGVTLSVVEMQRSLGANSVVRVEFQAPGYALHQSRIVIRLLP